MKTISTQKVTLSQYLQTYQIRKKINGRKLAHSKSKSKNKDDRKSQKPFYEQSKKKQSSLLQSLDNFLKNTKNDLQEIITNPQIKIEELYNFISNMLQKMIFSVKKQIAITFKHMYWYYTFQKENSDLNVKDHPQYEAALNFFRLKFNQAKQFQQKKQYSQMIQKMQKADQQFAQAAKMLIQDFINISQSTENTNLYEHKAAYTQKENSMVKITVQQQPNEQIQNKIVDKAQNINKIRKNTFMDQPNSGKSTKLIKNSANNEKAIVIQQSQGLQKSKKGSITQSSKKKQ